MLRRAAIACSVALHIALLALPITSRAPPTHRVPIELVLATPAKIVEPRGASSLVRATSRDPRVAPRVVPVIVAPSEVATDAPIEPAHVDLFARGAIERVVGTTIGASAQRDSIESPTAETNRRVDGWLGESTRRADVDAGRVDPAYRQLERSLHDAFHPPAAIVRPHGWGGAMRDQLKAFFSDPDRLQAPPESRFSRAVEGQDAPIGTAPGLAIRDMPLQQALTSQRALAQPVWLEAEVAFVVRADGTVDDSQLVKPSGFAPFDRYALEELRRIAALRRYELPRAATLTFRVRGSYVAKIPDGNFGFHFDETGNLGGSGRSRFLRPDNPVAEVKSEVRLLSVGAAH